MYACWGSRACHELSPPVKGIASVKTCGFERQPLNPDLMQGSLLALVFLAWQYSRAASSICSAAC